MGIWSRFPTLRINLPHQDDLTWFDPFEWLSEFTCIAHINACLSPVSQEGQGCALWKLYYRVPKDSQPWNLGCPALKLYVKGRFSSRPKTKVGHLWHPGTARTQPRRVYFEVPPTPPQVWHWYTVHVHVYKTQTWMSFYLPVRVCVSLKYGACTQN